MIISEYGYHYTKRRTLNSLRSPKPYIKILAAGIGVGLIFPKLSAYFLRDPLLYFYPILAILFSGIIIISFSNLSIIRKPLKDNSYFTLPMSLRHRKQLYFYRWLFDLLQLWGGVQCSLFCTAFLSRKSVVVSTVTSLAVFLIIFLCLALLRILLRTDAIQPKISLTGGRVRFSGGIYVWLRRPVFALMEAPFLNRIPAPANGLLKSQLLSSSRKDIALILMLISFPFLGAIALIKSANENIAIIYMMAGTIITLFLIIAVLSPLFELPFWRTLLPFSNRNMFISHLTLGLFFLLPWIIIGVLVLAFHGYLLDIRSLHCVGAAVMILFLSIRFENYHKTKPEYAIAWTSIVFWVVAMSFYFRMIWPAMILISFALFLWFIPKDKEWVSR